MKLYHRYGVAGLLLGSAPIFAQTLPADSNSGVAEVVVTAQRRVESSQKASVALDVLTGDTLKKGGVSEAADITNLLPGVQIAMGGPALQVYIRGVGDFGSTAISNPSVAINVDGVYQARTQSVGGSMFDLDRVEVLKGPQGTLYGRNASGGALNLIPASPVLNQFSGYASVTGQNYAGVTGEVAVNVPLSDSVAVRAGFQGTHRDGYLSDGTDDDIHESARLQLLYKPSEDFSLKLWESYNHQGGKGTGYALLNPDGAGVSGPTHLSNAWTAIDSPAGNAIVAAYPLHAEAGILDLYDSSKVFQDDTEYNVHAELNWDLGWANLTVIPAYQHADLRYTVIPALTYSTVTYDGTPEASSSESIETRLSGTSGPINWVVGGFYFNEDQNDTDSVTEGFIQKIYFKGQGNTKSYAGFGQATYSVLDDLRILAGLRYTREDKTLTGADYDAYPSTGCPATALPYFEAGIGPTGACSAFNVNGAYAANKTNYRAGIEYDVAKDSMLFGTVATGFKSGGLSYSTLPPYQAETLTASTIGSKNRFFDGRLQVNGELFYWDYKNHQESLITQIPGVHGLTTTQTYVNAGTASSEGGSLDITARVTGADLVHAAVEYVQSSYRTFQYQQYATFTSTGCSTSAVSSSLPPGQYGALLNVDCSGRQLTHSPKWSGTVSVTHMFDFSDGSTVDASADLAFASERWLSADFIPNTRAPAYAMLTLDATYHDPRDRYLVSLFVRNLNNAAVYTGGEQASFVPNLFAANIGAPRTYGATLRYNF